MPVVASEHPGTSRWLHYCALATACAALPLLLLGAEVTTKKVGMVDERGFRAPWHMVSVLIEKAQRGEPVDPGFVIEHSHRLAGFLVGILAIVLVVGLWLREKRAWLRWLGVLALAGVIAQGILGILRVNLNALMGRDLALVHGCFAQLVFALLVSMVAFTSRSWNAPAEPPASPRDARRLWRWGAATTCLVYLQIILGAVVRHRDLPFGARLHLLLSFGVVAAVVVLVKLVRESQPRRRQLMVPAIALACLVACQIVIGVEAWMARFPSPLWNQAQPLPVHPDLFRSLHYFVGALLFATTLVVTLHAHRRTLPAIEAHAASVVHLEGAL